MKIVKSKGEPFEFKFDGKTTLYIGKDGTTVSDLQARTLLERFAVEVIEATLEEVIEDAKSDLPIEKKEEVSEEVIEEKVEEKPTRKEKKDGKNKL